MGTEVVTLINADEGMLEYEDSGAWYQIPFIGSLQVAQQAGQVRRVTALNGTAQTTDKPGPPTITVQLASTIGSSKAIQDMREAAQEAEQKNFRITTRDETVLVSASGQSGEPTVSITVAGIVTFANTADAPALVKTDGYPGVGIGMVVKIGSNNYSIVAMDRNPDADGNTDIEVWPHPTTAVAAEDTFDLVASPKERIGPFLAIPNAAGGFSLAAGQNRTGSLSLACVANLPQAVIQ